MVKSYGSDTTNIVVKKNIAFVNFGGIENFGSINYEHVFVQRKKWNWSYSVGVQPFDVSKKFSLPVSLNTFTKGYCHHFEIDLTATFFMDKYHFYDESVLKEDFNKKLYISPFACYRFQKEKGVVFKAGIGPQILIDPPSNDIVKFTTKLLKPSMFGAIGFSF